MAGTPDVLTGTFAGRYSVERELGRGATATVYLARDLERGRNVAIKLMRAELAQSIGADRFLREIRLTAQLHHPHIVPVLDSGDLNGQLYCVLPHMEEGSLRQLLMRDKQLPIETAISIVRTVADALDYAHQQKLIHRDVKPENILFTSGQACLADFGIARAVERAIDESTTETGLVRGTPAYMSPEQASGSKHYDGRSDQYSLACVLYEMLAGVPAFIGPTPEAVIAQRFQHQPRELRVFRPSVPAAIEEVILKALSITAADRYASTAEFSRALEAAPRTPSIERRVSGPSVGFGRRKQFALLGAFVFAAGTLAALASAFDLTPWRHADTADSLRVAVLPFSAPDLASAPPHEMLHAALRRWQPLSVVPLDEVRQAMRAEGLDSVADPEDARRIATALNAGRYVTGRTLTTPSGSAVYADYRDQNGSLYTGQVDLPADSAKVRIAYAALSDSLLLRGKSDGGAANPLGARHLFASQALIAGIEARDEWNLDRADSLLELATRIDPSSTRAYLWLAQVRSWRAQPTEVGRWISAAERAVSDTLALSTIERRMAAGLLMLANGRYADACREYRQLVSIEDHNFIGWFGLGECRWRDSIVVADRRSPSGWRFRSSYQQAINAYVRAFEVLPATHKGFQAGAFTRLRPLLFTSGRVLWPGHTEGSTRRDFLATPSIVGDSLVAIPYERAQVLSGAVVPAAPAEAVIRLREIFHGIAMRWAAAYPASADAKEALAASLELRGDRSALDTIGSALRLATTDVQRLRLLATKVILQVKYALPDHLAALDSAATLADSLVRVRTQPTPEEAGLLAPLAALIGRCRELPSLSQRGATPLTLGQLQFAQDLVGLAYAVQARSAAGCAVSREQIDQVFDRIALVAPAPARLPPSYMLVGPAVRAALSWDSSWIARLAPVGGGLLAAVADYQRGAPENAARRLNDIERLRLRALPGEVTPDAVVPEARLWLALGDTTAALRVLESTIGPIRLATPLLPHQSANNVARMGLLVHAVALRARLEKNPRDARRWARAALALWRRADPELAPFTNPLRSIAQ